MQDGFGTKAYGETCQGRHIKKGDKLMITEALKKEIREYRLEDLEELRDFFNIVIIEKEKTEGVFIKKRVAKSDGS